jgi:cupin fold WbuC family metalloprotein
MAKCAALDRRRMRQNVRMSNPESQKPFPAALPAPDGREVVIDDDLILNAVRMSRESPRGRIIQRLHQKDDDPLQRMLNAIQPGSYVRPHRHAEPPRDESTLVIRGAIGLVTFSESGEVAAHHLLAPGHGVDLRAGILHTFFALEPDTVVFEAKAGPFCPVSEQDFAAFAPKEGTPESQPYLERLVALLPRRSAD